MKRVRAIFENGVFRPIQRVDLPDHCEVEFEPLPVRDNGYRDEEGIDQIYNTMSLRFRSGGHDVAARHNEHQP